MIYLDHHAATPCEPDVLQAMAGLHQAAWANPSSVHQLGRSSRQILETARKQCAAMLNALPADTVLTAGGTEACFLGIMGLAGAHITRVLTTAVEHPAVLGPVRSLEAQGKTLDVLKVHQGPDALMEDLQTALLSEHDLVCIQWVNHETGSIFPMAQIAALCATKGASLFVDATQALGKIPISILPGIHAMAFASHKIGGPPGAGALWLARDARFDSPLSGGGQERGRRGGSPDVVAMAGLGMAAAKMPTRLDAMGQVALLRDKLEQAMGELGWQRNASSWPRVATAINMALPQVRGDLVVSALDVEGLCVSRGSACSSGVSERSPVIHALHPQEPWRAEGAIRLSLGAHTTSEEIDEAIAIVALVTSRMIRHPLASLGVT